MIALIGFGAFGLLGSRTSTVQAGRHGYGLSVSYPSVTRPGLPVRWEIEVHHVGGFSEPIRLATTFDYLHLFDISNTEPDAASSSATSDAVEYDFAAPSGDTFRVAMDGNAEPGEHGPFIATTRLIVSGEPVVGVSYRTVMVP